MERNYSYSWEKLYAAVRILLILEMDEVEKIAHALSETLDHAKGDIPDEKGKEIIKKIESMIDKSKHNPDRGSYWQNINDMSGEQRQKLVYLIFELYNHVAREYYKKF